MENTASSSVPISPSPSTPTTPSSPPQPPATPLQKPQKNNWLIVGLVATFLVLAGTAGFFGYKYFQTQPPQPSPTPLSSAAPEKEGNPTANWQTYTSQDKKYTLKYPQDWVLEDKSEYVDLYQDGNSQLKHDISISKNNHSFKSYNPLAWGPSVCLYPDSPSFEGPSQQFDNYIEIKTPEDIYRRPQNSTQEQENNQLRWTVCKTELTSGQFSTVAGFGTAWYETPFQYDPQLLQTMDLILSTFQFLDQNDETANWKTYEGNAYTFKYPANYSINGADTNVTLSHETAVFITIYPLETLTYQNFPECTESLAEVCLVKYKSQTNLVEDIFVDGKKSKSFYFTGGGPDNDYRRVEIIAEPGTDFNTGINVFLGDINQARNDVEAKDKIFNLILSTFKFTN